MSKAPPKNFKITNADLILYTPVKTLLTSIEGFVFGFLGLTISWIAVELAFPILFEVPNAFLIVVFFGSFVFALMGLYRNWIVRRIANPGLAWTYWIQRALSWLFWIGVFLAIYALLAIKQVIADYSIPLSILLAGSYFLLATPRFLFGQLMPELREARL